MGVFMNHSLKEKKWISHLQTFFAYIYALCLTFGNSFYSICVRLVEFSSAKILKWSCHIWPKRRQRQTEATAKKGKKTKMVKSN